MTHQTDFSNARAGGQRPGVQPPVREVAEVEVKIPGVLEPEVIDLPKLVHSTIKWKSIPKEKLNTVLEARAEELFGKNKPVLDSAKKVIAGIASKGVLDWQYGQILENWMVFINFADQTGLTGPDALIKLNEISFSERAKDFSRVHAPDSLANRTAVNEIVADGLKQAAEFMQVMGRFHVHDAGCADGSRTEDIMKALSKRGVRCEFSGSDISRDMVELAKSRGLVEVVQANLLEGILLEHTAHAVICVDDTIGHIPGVENRKTVLREFAGISAERGFVILDVNNSEGHFTPRTRKNDEVRNLFSRNLPEKERAILEGLSDGEHLYTVAGAGPVCYLHHFTKAELVRMLEDAGYEIFPVTAKSAGSVTAQAVNTVSLRYKPKEGPEIQPGTVNEGFNQASLVVMARKKA